MEKFNIGDIVEWTSQSGGYTRTKSGEIVAIVPAEDWAQKHFEKLGLKQNSSCGYGMPRNHESYLVKIKNRCYFPRVKKLKRLNTEKTGN